MLKKMLFSSIFWLVEKSRYTSVSILLFWDAYNSRLSIFCPKNSWSNHHTCSCVYCTREICWVVRKIAKTHRTASYDTKTGIWLNKNAYRDEFVRYRKNASHQTTYATREGTYYHVYNNTDWSEIVCAITDTIITVCDYCNIYQVKYTLRSAAVYVRVILYTSVSYSFYTLALAIKNNVNYAARKLGIVAW